MLRRAQIVEIVDDAVPLSDRLEYYWLEMREMLGMVDRTGLLSEIIDLDW